jgi:thiamine-phosphate pyrophosphorylase
MMARFPRGLYALTPEETDTAALVAHVRAALAGGAVAIQYRHKAASPALAREQAGALKAVCRTAGVPLIVNDDIALALEVGADGVHLGRDDGDLVAVRARLGSERVLGASCYDELTRAVAAARAGVDYVAFGSVFPSPTKPHAVHAPLTLFTEAKQSLAIPLVAIGGITLDNAPRVIAAGADAVAVITALFEDGEVEARARAFQSLFKEDPQQ